jgi:hypothetical protein
VLAGITPEPREPRCNRSINCVLSWPWTLGERPCPFRQRFESGHLFGAQLASSVEGALIADPVAQLVFAFHVTPTNPRSAFTLYVAEQHRKSLFPLIGEWVPAPARERFEAGDSAGTQSPICIEGALGPHPVAKGVVLHAAFDGNAGMTVLPSECFEQAVARLPTIGNRVPGPAGEGFEAF